MGSEKNTMASDIDYPPILDASLVAELLGMNVQMMRKSAR